MNSIPLFNIPTDITKVIMAIGGFAKILNYPFKLKKKRNKWDPSNTFSVKKSDDSAVVVSSLS